jgi:2,3-diaminopropionate biosynthesis protein SbnA
MLATLDAIGPLVGNTPLKKIHLPGANAFVKLEYLNHSGSIKDRAAYHIVREGMKRKDITENTVIVESSSGNFAIALAMLCRAIGIKFIPVIDPNISGYYEKLLRLLCPDMVKVKDLDSTGGYLLTRIEKVAEICSQTSGSFWTNQYGNPDNYLAYYHTLGGEICDSFDRLDYVFIGVSSGGTITGVSRRIKEKFARAKVIAVDIEGSVIFGGCPKRRLISGIGSSKIPSILQHALIDEVMYVTHVEIVEGCRELLSEQTILGGPSAGAAYAAIKKFIGQDVGRINPTILFLCPDRGTAYLDSLYNDAWAKKMRETLNTPVLL